MNREESEDYEFIVRVNDDILVMKDVTFFYVRWVNYNNFNICHRTPQEMQHSIPKEYWEELKSELCEFFL